MSHLRCWAVGCVAVLIVGVVETDRAIAAEPGLTAARRVAREAESRLLAGLHKQVKAEWSNVPLEEVLVSLAKTAGVNLWIDREALSADGIALDSEVDLHLGEVTVWQALHFLLKPLSLAWVAPDGILEITTTGKSEESFVTRTYDVTALVKVLEPQLKNSAVVPRGLRHDTCNGTHYVQSETFAKIGRQSRFPAETVLAALLESSVDAKWMMIDGNGGRVAVGHNRLIVRHTYQIHFEIQSLLQAVETLVVRGVKEKSIHVRRPGYPLDEDVAINQRLAKPMDIEMTELPLHEALEWLVNETHIRVVLDRQSLDDEGVSIESPVSLTLTGAPLTVVLKTLLSPIRLTAVVEEGTVVITTQPKAAEKFQTIVYDDTDLPEAANVNDLMSIVQEATSGPWEQADGTGGSLSFLLRRVLVVRHTQAVHSEIAAVFDELREQRVDKLGVEAPEIELRLYPVTDVTAIDDLMIALPKLVPTWDGKNGSMHRLGQSLAIKQPAQVHERLDEIFSTLDQAHARLSPPKPTVEPKPDPAPAKKQ